tara:strand:- start:1219 stop:1728 length:510 start_codon:yes stop_codon:yes gene_type:complete
MAKSDSFFIRAAVSTNGVNYAQVSIDTGAYVDALGKSVLRIHNIAVQYGGPTDAYVGSADTNNTTAFQLTTQTQSAMVNATDKSLIASGRLAIATSQPTPGTPVVAMMSESLDVAPQHWRNGYLVGVEQLYLGTDSVGGANVDQVSVIMECTVETLSQSAAMALALSQQ